MHLAYAGQPDGHGTQHHWRLFCDESLKSRLEASIRGTALTSQSSDRAKGNYSQEWGGLYLRSRAEIEIARSLDRMGLLFFANARGRIGLENVPIANEQLSGRVEVDFLVFWQGKCLVLEVDGQHHLEREQSLRDSARDRALLLAGVPTVRFCARDCLSRPDEVVLECLAILQAR